MNLRARVLGILLELSTARENRLDPEGDEPAFDSLLTGICSGEDPVWETIVLDIGPFYWRPADAFSHAFPGESVKPSELSVISWVLPQTQATRKDHRGQKQHPSLRWSKTRLNGEAFNVWLRRELAARLAGEGIQATAPVLLDQWRREDSDRHGYASTWSERHTAFACGLGTFGLSDGLITPAGKAVRLGSVVVRAELEPSPRPYGEDHHAYCLFYRDGTCRKCAKRCPAGAISPVGHDKVACRKYIREVTAPYVATSQLGVPVNACGLCQTGVPCEAGIPGIQRHRPD